MFKVCSESDSPHEGACLRYIYGEPESAESQHEAGCFRDMVNRNRQKKGACLKYMVDRNRQVRGRVKRYDEPVQPISPNEGACLRYVMSLYRCR